VGTVGAARHVTCASHPDLRVHRSLRFREKDRKAYYLEFVSGPDRILQINDGSIDTLETALLERVFFRKVDGAFVQPPQVSTRTMFAKLGRFGNRLSRSFGARPARISPEQFVEMYSGRKRKLYEGAANRLLLTGLLRKYGYVMAFVKLEKVKFNKAPRCIQPRTPEYNVALGTFLKPIEHKMYRALALAAGMETPVVAKGMNANEVGALIQAKWERFDTPVAVGLDATAFDQHVGVSALKFEHSVYKALFKYDPDFSELLTLLQWQIDNKGFGYCFDGFLKYRIKGRRFSGDMNTAMGNCIIMCAIVSTFLKNSGVKHDFVNNGDDCVVFLEERDLYVMSGFREFALSLGFVIVQEEPVRVIERVEFCQQRPVWVDGQYRMIRNQDTAREKDSMSLLHHQDAQSVRKWLRAVGECGLALCSGVPVMQAMYLAYIREGIAGKTHNAMGMDTGASYLARGMEAKAQPIHPDTRVSYFMAFDVTPADQLALEESFGRWFFSGEIREVDTISDVATLTL